MLGIYDDLGQTFTTICLVYPQTLAARLLKLHPSTNEIAKLAHLCWHTERVSAVKLCLDTLDRSVNVAGMR